MEESDPDLDEAKSPPKRSRGNKQPGSSSAEPEQAVTMDGLKLLFQEQSQVLLAAQREQMQQTMAEYEKNQAIRMESIESRVEKQQAQHDDLASQFREMGERLQALEARGSPHAVGPDRKLTLVFGGWPMQTRRETLLTQLHQALEALDLASSLDQRPFTTGPRRSVALCNFMIRQGEDAGGARQRMLKVLQAVNGARVEVEGCAKPLWCSFSRSPAERGRAAVAAIVKKVLMTHAPGRACDLDVEFASGIAWIRDDQLSGMGAPPPECSKARVLETKAGPAWLDESTLAKWLGIDKSVVESMVSSHRDYRVVGWNIGGSDLHLLSKAVQDGTGSGMRQNDLALIQEVPREGEGWSFATFQGRRLVSHRDPQQWRGTGLWYDERSWCVLKKIGTLKGTWFKIRSLETDFETWVGTAHFSPGCTVQVYEEEVENHFRGLPTTAHRVLFQGDVNTGFLWQADATGTTAIAKEGKGNILHKVCMERELSFLPPRRDCMQCPTSRPRQTDREGQCIDVFVGKRVSCRQVVIHVDSYLCAGTDHEIVEGSFAFATPKVRTRHDSQPRVVHGDLPQLDYLDQRVLEGLARDYTKPKQGQGYRDPPEVKKAFREAKQPRTAALWKNALKLRKVARQHWEKDRLARAARGDWAVFKSLKRPKQVGWDVAFAECQTGDPHELIHQHLASVYEGVDLPQEEPWTGSVAAFTAHELRVAVGQMKKGKSVGVDGTSAELMSAVLEAPGGETHLLEFYNRVLATQQIPSQWNEALLILLPKVTAPKHVRELRPIAMSSAVGKVFSRLLLNRALPLVSPSTYAQCAGPHRQTSDYLYAAFRSFELAREWGHPFAILKLDLEKAFDKLDRSALVRQLESRIGPGPELQCWKALLRGVRGRLQTPWGSSTVRMDRGIKQGSIESPCFFSHVTEVVLAMAVETRVWQAQQRVLEGLDAEEMLFVDDGLLWSRSCRSVQLKVEMLVDLLHGFGLSINPAKCSLYVTHNVEDGTSVTIRGFRVEASDHMEIMGIRMYVGISIYELVAPLASRARAKFWEYKHILRCKTGMKDSRDGQHCGSVDGGPSQATGLSNIEKHMNQVTGGPWREKAHDRKGWKQLEEQWILNMDLPWASGRQHSIKVDDLGLMAQHRPTIVSSLQLVSVALAAMTMLYVLHIFFPGLFGGLLGTFPQGNSHFIPWATGTGSTVLELPSLCNVPAKPDLELVGKPCVNIDPSFVIGCRDASFEFDLNLSRSGCLLPLGWASNAGPFQDFGNLEAAHWEQSEWCCEDHQSVFSAQGGQALGITGTCLSLREPAAADQDTKAPPARSAQDGQARRVQYPDSLHDYQLLHEFVATDQDIEDPPLGVSLLSTRVLLVLGVPLGSCFDEPFPPDRVPGWYDRAVDDARFLQERGCSMFDIFRAVDAAMAEYQDPTFVEETELYVSGIRRALHQHQGTVTTDPVTLQMGLPAEAEVREYAVWVARLFRDRWHWTRCPVAMQNMMDDLGLVLSSLPCERYADELYEKQRLSRSRSPQRRTRARQHEKRTGERVDEGEETDNVALTQKRKQVATPEHSRDESSRRRRTAAWKSRALLNDIDNGALFEVLHTPPQATFTLDPPEAVPFGIFHAAHVWPSGGWNTRAELIRMGRADLVYDVEPWELASAPSSAHTPATHPGAGQVRYDNTETEEVEEEDGFSLMQTHGGSDRGHQAWEVLMSVLSAWLARDRQVVPLLDRVQGLALRRGNDLYGFWIRGPMATMRLSSTEGRPGPVGDVPDGEEANSWVVQVERFLWEAFLRDYEHTAAEPAVNLPEDEQVNLMERQRRAKDDHLHRRVQLRAAPLQDGGGLLKVVVNTRALLDQEVTEVTPPRMAEVAHPDRLQALRLERAVRQTCLDLGGSIFSNLLPGTKLETFGDGYWGWTVTHGHVEHIMQHFREMSDANRAMMTVAFTQVLRYIMAECSNLMHMGDLQGREDTGDLVTVTLDPTDEEGPAEDDTDRDRNEDVDLMQRFTLTGGRGSMEDRWARNLARMQKELGAQNKMACLPGSSFNLGVLPVEQLAEVVDDSPPPPLPVAGLGGGHLQPDCPQPALHTQAADLYAQQELNVVRQQAAEYQAWERDLMSNELRRAPGRKRSLTCCTLEVEAASGSGDRPRVSHTYQLTVPESGDEVRLTIRARMTQAPEEVTTEEIFSEGENAQEPQHTQRATCATARNVLELLEFGDFAKVYAQWKAGTLNLEQVVAEYGNEVAEMLMTHDAIEMDDTDTLTGMKKLPKDDDVAREDTGIGGDQGDEGPGSLHGASSGITDAPTLPMIPQQTQVEENSPDVMQVADNGAELDWDTSGQQNDASQGHTE
ncbi:Pol [Symbiodinium sp. CCMP2592]|nr:Pol [Symbiodinium sp. CCMP2592]